MHLLFICSKNRWRSPTAEAIYRQCPGLSVRSRGTSPKAVRHVSPKDLQWADHIFVMERKHAQRLRADHPAALHAKPLHVLSIPDHYRYMDPALVALLQSTIDPILATLKPN